MAVLRKAIACKDSSCARFLFVEQSVISDCNYL